MKAKYWNARKLFYEKGSLIKVNITVRCHNPRRALTHRELFPRNGHSIFCLHVILLQPLTCCLSCVTRHVKNMTKWRAKPTFAMTIKKVWLRVTKVHGIINLRKRWMKLGRSRSLIQVKTSQILTIQDRLLKKIMLPSLGSAFFVLLFFFFSFPHLYGALNFKKENVTVKFPRRSYCSLWAVWVPSFHWLAAYPVDILLRWRCDISSNAKNSQSLFTRIPCL